MSSSSLDYWLQIRLRSSYDHYKPYKGSFVDNRLTVYIEERAEKCGVIRHHWHVYQKLLLFFMWMKIDERIDLDTVAYIVRIAFGEILKERIEDAIANYGWSLQSPKDSRELYLIPTTRHIVDDEKQRLDFWFAIQIKRYPGLCYIPDLFLDNDWMTQRLATAYDDYYYYAHRQRVYTTSTLQALHILFVLVDAVLGFLMSDLINDSNLGPMHAVVGIFVNPLKIMTLDFRYASYCAVFIFLWMEMLTKLMLTIMYE